jgi:hypothetical protein
MSAHTKIVRLLDGASAANVCRDVDVFGAKNVHLYCILYVIIVITIIIITHIILPRRIIA